MYVVFRYVSISLCRILLFVSICKNPLSVSLLSLSRGITTQSGNVKLKYRNLGDLIHLFLSPFLATKLHNFFFPYNGQEE